MTLDLVLPAKRVAILDEQTRPIADVDHVQWLQLKRKGLKHGGVGGIQIKDLGRHLVLERRWWFWVAPVMGKGAYVASGKAIPDEAQFLLGSDGAGERFICILPLCAGDWRAYLRGAEEGLVLGAHGGEKTQRKCKEPLAIVTWGSDPIRLVQQTVALAARRMGTFRLRSEKREPAFVQWLGWCTWDAFYQEVSAEKIIAGLESFKAGGLQPRFMILDDGWQEIDDKGRMLSFATNERFPDGLSSVTRQAKDEYGIECFGIWHALQGYWAGVAPKGPLGKHYQVSALTGRRPSVMQEQRMGIVKPVDIHRFYQDWYTHLRSQGIDMVKVDSQSGLQEYTPTGHGYGSTMRAYQQALQGAAQTHFEGNLLHCMSNSQDVAYHMSSSVAWRNSDDFYPKQPASHSRHLVQNTYNSLWSHTFSLPDWDMFQSSHEAGPFHAAGRAISGGPVYISDAPGTQDFALLRRLCTSDGRVLRCSQPALPVGRQLFVDPTVDDVLLLVANRNGSAGVVGAFHCQHEGRPISGVITARDAGMADGRCARWQVAAEKLSLVEVADELPVTLAELEWELVHFVALDREVAALGLLDKFNPPAAIREAGWHDELAYRCELVDGGSAGFALPRQPQAVLIDGAEAQSTFHDGLLRVTVPTGGPALIELRFGG